VVTGPLSPGCPLVVQPSASNATPRAELAAKLCVLVAADTARVAVIDLDDSAAWARALGARRLNITIAPNGLDVSHLLHYYTARGFRDEGPHPRPSPLSARHAVGGPVLARTTSSVPI
jgi:hypothetical protein